MPQQGGQFYWRKGVNISVALQAAVTGKDNSPSPADLAAIRTRLLALKKLDPLAAAALVHALPPGAREKIGPEINAGSAPAGAPAPAGSGSTAASPAPAAGAAGAAPAPAVTARLMGAKTLGATPTPTPTPAPSAQRGAPRGLSDAEKASVARLRTAGYKWQGADFVAAVAIAQKDPTTKAKFEKQLGSWKKDFDDAVQAYRPGQPNSIAPHIPLAFALTSVSGTNKTASEALASLYVPNGPVPSAATLRTAATAIDALKAADPASAAALLHNLPPALKARVVALGGPGFAVSSAGTGAPTPAGASLSQQAIPGIAAPDATWVKWLTTDGHKWNAVAFKKAAETAAKSPGNERDLTQALNAHNPAWGSQHQLTAAVRAIRAAKPGQTVNLNSFVPPAMLDPVKSGASTSSASSADGGEHRRLGRILGRSFGARCALECHGLDDSRAPWRCQRHSGAAAHQGFSLQAGSHCGHWRSQEE